MKKILFVLFISFLSLNVFAQNQRGYSLKIAKVKYSGGGDWYANKTALPNLADYCNDYLGTSIDVDDEIVEIGSPELFNYAYVYLTGHGNVVFSDSDAENLRNYLSGGGFLHIDDNYGLDKFIRLEMKKVFPELDFVEIPFDHPIYHQVFDFPNGLPKIHEHDGKPAQGFGLVYDGRLICFYSFESDLGNGWEDPSIHRDPEEVRSKALQMGTNIISFALTDF
ncbi:DUF4159 domain-containing protein [Flammeovirga kamogawensis]|uniref:DUF4159 domain-containing protein n=1 Tax=Flammeovirga kamogawensis TaxID=373891 RepID=A0ABX8GWP3_9BACT|nr:DUF4159 domain-containing protein [Flammeovirga kamogawensis]MBB6460668.1 hypothetical protein [Flammeovirga kamogawensis]QWG08023.1 DUF4159 domain-containing protein [Flammeovirga kamogawensis]TRX69830.1 DUF4159 domain-containing protein [Flammeovirga kamogawensis]